MAFSFKTSIAFGLVYIPIQLSAVIKNNDIGFNMLDKKTKSRVKYQKTCEECNDRIVKNEDIVKGYQIDKDEYVVFKEEELEKLKTKGDKNIIIEKFVSLNEINPIYFDKTYYVVPEKKNAQRAYCLLLNVLKDEKKVGIAKTMIGSSECVVALWAQGKDMILSRLYFDDEVQSNPAENINENIDKKEFSLAKTIIQSMSGRFNPKDYKDEYNERVRKAILDKAEGKQIKSMDDGKMVKITDLMEALQKSVKNIDKGKDKEPCKVVKIKKKA